MIKRWATKLAAGALVATAALGAGSAQAATTLQFDVNNAKGAATPGGFSTTYTGNLKLSLDGNTLLVGLFIDGNLNALGAGWAISAIDVSIDFLGGNIVGGSYKLSVSNGLDTDTFEAVLIDGNGAAGNIGLVGSNFTIFGGVQLGTFTSVTVPGEFGGVNVADFIAAEPLRGRFDEFFFAPNSAGVDNDTDIDLFVIIPAPPAVLWGLAGLAGLAIGRKRLRSLGLSKR